MTILFHLLDYKFIFPYASFWYKSMWYYYNTCHTIVTCITHSHGLLLEKSFRSWLIMAGLNERPIQKRFVECRRPGSNLALVWLRWNLSFWAEEVLVSWSALTGLNSLVFLSTLVGVQGLRPVIAAHWSPRGSQKEEHQPHHENYTHELIVRSCELLQQPSDVMIVENPSAPPHPSPPLQLIGQPAALRNHLPRQKPVTHFKCYFSLLLKINFRDLCKFISFSDTYRYVFKKSEHFCLIL